MIDIGFLSFHVAIPEILIVNCLSKVIGAAMFYAKVGDTAIVYTGDYNMTPDRHLGAAQIDRLHLDLLITEYDIISCTCFSIIDSILTP